MQGWLRLHRRFLEWEWYHDMNTKVLFLHLLLKANHKDKNWQGTVIKRGEFVTSLDKLKHETGLTIKQIRLSLDKLKKSGEIDKQTTSKFTRLTIVNFNKYQQEGKQRANKETNGGQAEGKQRATTKNEKNNKNENNKEDGLSFEDFWSLYHDKLSKRKTDKNSALKYWNKLNGSEQQKAIESIEPYSKTKKESDKEAEYMKKAYTYLRDKTFNDEFDHSVTDGGLSQADVEYYNNLAKQADMQND
jgi:hypothetical protein